MGFTVLLVLTGRLVPRSVARAQIEQANRNAELWQQAAAKQAERADLAVAQATQMLTGFATIEALLRSLSPVARRQR